jgi:hypothetical protein
MAYRFRSALLIGIGILAGVLIAPQLSASTSLAQSTQPGCQTFTQTRHTVCGRFLDYWKTHGGLAQQGYPLSEEFVETSALNGRPYTVQYFERAVFEFHPENQTPNDVLLSQLGTFLGNEKYTKGFPSQSGEAPFYEDRTDPAHALLSFYNAVNRKEYERAYSYYQGAPNPQTSLAPPYAQFVQGYANTASVTIAVGKVELGAAAGNIYASMPVVITATQKDGTKQLFAGCYVMHRVNTGISENPNDELWSIWSAKISAVPVNSSVDSLLAQTCTP